jgi:5'-nucleotidase (lipoprotein e(P4) family)
MKHRNYILTLGLILTSAFSGFFATAADAQTADNEYQISGTLYMQKAAEYRALCYQAFNLAQMNLTADFDKKNLKKLPKAERKMLRAIVVDIDETVLDNSPAQAYGIKNNKSFNTTDWYAWGEMRKAKAIPGAVDFLQSASRKNVRIFYVSNRDEVQKQATIDNLKAVGFPDVSAETVLLRTTESGKEPRRQIILQKHRIIMLFGDNLNDFSNIFEKKSIADRFAETDKMRPTFGAKFIVLPNAMYGDWESAIYEYDRKLTDAQKKEKRANALELP